MLTSEGPVEFCISAKNSNYCTSILFNIFLYVSVSITAADGTALAENTEIAPECNFLYILRSQCDMHFNVFLATQSNNNYPYRAYIERLSSFSTETKPRCFFLLCDIEIHLTNSILAVKPTLLIQSVKDLWLKASKETCNDVCIWINPFKIVIYYIGCRS